MLLNIFFLLNFEFNPALSSGNLDYNNTDSLHFSQNVAVFWSISST